jgi:hypothetical protein
MGAADGPGGPARPPGDHEDITERAVPAPARPRRRRPRPAVWAALALDVLIVVVFLVR